MLVHRADAAVPDYKTMSMRSRGPALRTTQSQKNGPGKAVLVGQVMPAVHEAMQSIFCNEVAAACGTGSASCNTAGHWDSSSRQ